MLRQSLVRNIEAFAEYGNLAHVKKVGRASLPTVHDPHLPTC
jgi:hypothetical protein